MRFEMLFLQQLSEMWHNENFHIIDTSSTDRASLYFFFPFLFSHAEKNIFLFNFSISLSLSRSRCIVLIPEPDFVCSCRRTEASAYDFIFFPQRLVSFSFGI